MVYEKRKSTSIENKAKKTAGKYFSVKDIDVLILQSMPYVYPRRTIDVELSFGEFTCLCPFSGLPDFARLTIRYVPDRKLIELKSLKYYLYAFRNVKVYNEHAINKILDDLVGVVRPRELTVEGEFTSRGGIENRVTVCYRKKAKRVRGS